MNRLIAATAAAATTAALTLSATPAQAAVAKADLLSAKQVTKVVGSKASQSVTKMKTFEKFTGCKQTGTVQGKSGLMGLYSAGMVFVGNGVIEAKSQAQAKQVMGSYIRVFSKCKKVTMAGVSTKVKKIKVPALGQQRIGYRATMSGITSDAIFVRKGKKIVVVSYAAQKAAPAKLVKLAKAAVKKA